MSTIQKSEVIKEIVGITGSSFKDTENTINALFTVLGQTLRNYDKAQFTGFGVFNAKNVPARDGRNPATGEAIKIAARRQVTFKVGSELKKTVNE